MSRVIPPSTSSIARLPTASSIRRARAIRSTLYSMKRCPPKPGFTLMIRSRSISRTISSTVDSEVAGLSVTPAMQPSSLMRATWRSRCGAASTWIVSTFAPAFAKSST